MSCLVCLAPKLDLMEVFGEEGSILDCAAVLNKYFWFDLSENDLDSKSICLGCWYKISEFHKFYNEVMRLHFELKHDTNDYVGVQEMEVEKLEKVEKLEEVDFEFIEDNFESADEGNVSHAETVDVLSIKSEATTTARSKNERAEKRERQKRNDQEQHKIKEVCKMQCDQCEYQFHNWTDMKGHYLKQHDNPNGYLICTCCDLKFRKRFHIFDHIEYIANPEAFKCDVCSKTYDRRESLQNHLLTHQPERHTYKCDICGRGYVKKGLLAAHLRIAHVAVEDKHFPCPQCGMRFVTLAIMKCHIKSRHEKAYSKVCEICAKVLGNKLDYERHKANNHGNVAARVQCKACKKWMQECSVSSHAQCCRERPDKSTYVCDICQKECPSIRALQGHKRYVHVKERSFQCTVCEKSFKRALNLKEHVATHTNSPLYNCIFCPKTFNSSANCMAHRKKMHKEAWELSQQYGPNAIV